jgi:hypothetical protein
MNSTVYEFIKIKYRIDSLKHMKCTYMKFYRHPHLEAETTLWY